MTAATSGVDVLLNAPAIRYHMYEEARAEHGRVHARLEAAAAAAAAEEAAAAELTGSGSFLPDDLGALGATRGALAVAAATEAAARALLPALAAVSLDAAKAQFDSIPQTRVAPYAGPDPAAAAAAAKGAKGGAKGAKPPPKPAAKRPATAGPGGKAAASAAGLPAGATFAVTAGPRQWSAGGAASTYAFAENPLLLEKRLQGIRDDALGIGKKKKRKGSPKKKK